MVATSFGRWSRASRLLVVAGLLASGSASAESGNPKNCWEVKQRNPSAADGDYTIEPARGKAFTVYCAGLKEYLPLVVTGSDRNYSQYTAGGASLGTDVRTSFTRLRIDPLTFLVDMSDTTFSTSTGLLCHSSFSTSCPEAYQVTVRPYATAWDCQTTNSATGSANIDLGGTPFAVSNVFSAFGFYAAGTVTVDGVTTELLWNQTVPVNGQVVDFTGGGYCGFVGPIDSYYSNLLQLKWAAD